MEAEETEIEIRSGVESEHASQEFILVHLGCLNSTAD